MYQVSETIYHLRFLSFVTKNTRDRILKKILQDLGSEFFLQITIQKCIFFSIYIVYNSTQKVTEIVIKLTVIKLRSYTINIEFNQ